MAEHDNGPLSIRTGRWRYIYNPDNVTTVCHPRGDYYKIDTEELYDVLNDPDEQDNVIDDHPDVSSALRQDLLASYPVADEGREPIMADESALEELRALGYLV
jgi:hypothetical protein